MVSNGRYAALAGDQECCDLDRPMMMIQDEGDVPLEPASTNEGVVPVTVPVPKSSTSALEYPPEQDPVRRNNVEAGKRTQKVMLQDRMEQWKLRNAGGDPILTTRAPSIEEILISTSEPVQGEPSMHAGEPIHGVEKGEWEKE